MEETVAALYRSDWGRIVAALIRLTGDFDLAEDAAQEAFAAAVAQWPQTGVPEYPRSWIIQTARHKALDRIRRDKRMEPILDAEFSAPAADYQDDEIPDDRLRLIFTCCHPALAPEVQIALTMREICGLTTDEIARAFLLPVPTMAQRLVRAKRKIREARIPYVVPERQDMPERLHSVLTVLYLVFSEGYSATSGDEPIRAQLCQEAIHLAMQLRDLLPSPELSGLLALMQLQDARRKARFDAAGNLILLEVQDRGLWDRQQINAALPLVEDAMRSEPGPFAVQAAIAAEHCQAATPVETDWRQIASLYRLLEALQPSPVITLNRAVAVSMVEGPESALTLLEPIATDLENYHLFHATRADFLRRLGARRDAAESYRRALHLATNPADRAFLESRLLEMES